MKKRLKLLSICLLIPLTFFGQTISRDTSLIMTPQQLRITNLIFLEHEKLKKEVPLLKEQLYNYKKLDSLTIKHDDFQNKQLENLNFIINKQSNKISKMKTIQNIGLGTIVALIIGLVCK